MHNIAPFEVTSNKEHSAVSLGKFRRKFSGSLHTPAVLHPKDLKTWNGILHLPLYMTPLIAEIPQKKPSLRNIIDTAKRIRPVLESNSADGECDLSATPPRLGLRTAALDILVSGSDSQS